MLANNFSKLNILKYLFNYILRKLFAYGFSFGKVNCERWFLQNYCSVHFTTLLFCTFLWKYYFTVLWKLCFKHNQTQLMWFKHRKKHRKIHWKNTETQLMWFKPNLCDSNTEQTQLMWFKPRKNTEKNTLCDSNTEMLWFYVNQTQMLWIHCAHCTTADGREQRNRWKNERGKWTVKSPVVQVPQSVLHRQLY